jgi:hypothetical protein
VQLTRLDFKGSPGCDDYLKLPNTLQVLSLRTPDTYLTFEVAGTESRFPFLRDLTLQGDLEEAHLVPWASRICPWYPSHMSVLDLDVCVRMPNVRRYYGQ